MANTNDIKAATAVVDAAKAAFDAAEAAFLAVDASVIASLSAENAAIQAASNAFEAALETARGNTDWETLNQAYLAADSARVAALASLQVACDSFDGS